MELITAFTIHNIFSKQQIQTIVHYSDESYNGDSNMNCTINDLNLSFDKDNRLRTTIGRVAGWSVDKAYVLASFLQDESFKKYLSKMLTDKDIIGGTTIDLKNITDNDYININQNKLGSLLNVYYIDHYHSVNNSKTNKALGRLNGFSSGTAKTVGLNYTADRIIDKYYNEFGKAKPKKSQEIIAEVINDIEHELYKQVNLFANNVISSDKYSKAARDYAQKFIDIIKRIEENNNKIKETTIFANANKNQLRQYNGKKVTEEEKAIIKRLTDTDKQYKEELAALGKDNARAALDRYVIAQNLVNLYANNVDGALNKRLRNFANLVAQMKGDTNGWFFQVMNTKRMTSIVKEFNNIGDIEEYIEQQDENNDNIIDKYNGKDVDQTTKSWEDSLYKSFNSAISGKMRIILSRIPKLSSPFNPTAETQSLDTENELGVKTYMDSQFITVQMFSFGDFSDIESMVRSIERRANTVEELYGIGMLVNQMKQDKVFANYMYANFAKPLVNKTMCVISDLTKESGITFNYSNANAFYSTKMAFDMMNKLRASYNTQYDINDYKTIQALGNKLRNPKLPIEFDDTETIYNTLLKYFPNIKREVYNNFLRGIKDDKRNALINFTQNLIAIINGAGALKTKINTAIEQSNKKYNNDKKKFNQDYNAYVEAGDVQAIKRMKYPTYQGVDYTEYDLDPNTLKAVIRLAENLSDYSASKARLNTANAEGNTASDVTKNCYITRFFEQINAGTEEDSNAGLHALLDYIIQGTENGKENQYSNNPLFFGVKDENGRVIIPGMFTRVGDIFDINKNAKEILNYSLFDGTKNTQSGNGSGYASMPKLDFFITQYIAYANSVGDINENGINKKIGNLDSSVYAMRIGSDAPKIYMIRAPRYNYRQLQYAFYNHLMDELNMYVNGLNKIFRKNNAGEYKLITTTNGLYGRAFFDERAADNLRKDGKKDMSKAFVEENNGRLQLAGKMFKFLRLFDANGHSAAIDIETALSLYGGVDANSTSLFIKDGRTKLKLNKDYINSENGFIKELTDEQGTRFVLDLGATQKKALLNIVDNWMKNVLQESTARTSDFVQAMEHNNIQYTQPMIQSFILNALNMNMNYDDMFEGDFKFYNNARDFLKRTKESQAGGDGYSGYRLTEFPRGEIIENTYFGEPEIINVKTAKNIEAGNYIVPTYDNGSIINKPMAARNGWRAVTIHNTIKPSDVAMDLQETLEEEFISQGMSKEYAHARSVKIAGGYFAQTKVNDAQSFITLEEFIRRKYADGTIGDYQDLIAQLLDPNVKAEDIDVDAVNVRIQVQKNFYFDKPFDPYTGTFAPRQIKNAEFVLIPKLLPQDSDLIKVYEWMRANDIGQLNTAETDKAAKKNIFTIWSEDTGEFIDPRNNKKFREDYIQNYYYQYLYKQQDVPQHMINEENKLGAQIQKKIIDNVSTASKQVQDWANEYQEALVENIREDYIRFLDRMGWEYDFESGHIVNSEYATKDANGNPLPAEVIKSNRETLNLTDYYTRAREEAARLGMDSNFIEYLIPNEFGVTTMPNLMNNAASKLESVAQALFNRTVTRQTMPGWHAAQVTDVGYSRRLKFDPKTGVMEVYLPRWSNLLPKPKNAEEEKKLLEQIAKEGLDIHLGYRIPTEGKQSISVLRVVGFTNDALGSTIIVPEEWVTQTGSDFDVDSIYGISYEIYAKKDKKGNITVYKIPCEEDKVDNDNLYINYVNSRLEDKVKRSDIGEEIESRIKELRDSLKAQIGDKLNSNNTVFVTVDTQRNELFNKLPAWARGIIVNEQAKAKRVAKKDKVSVDLRGEYQAINKLFDEQLTKRNLDDATADIIKQYMDYQTSLINIMNEQDGITTFDKDEYISSKKDIIATAVENARKEQVKLCEEKATELGLMSYDDFAKQPLVKRLSRKARNNYILDRMINIMNDRSSREEQYGRSQFEGIAGEKTSANDIINKISGQSKRSYSPYNPLDQLDYFEDAMGGARLKALSVNWDTFVSKCNRTHPFLSEEDSVEVIIPEDHIEDSAIDYDIKAIERSFDYGLNTKELTYNSSNDNTELKNNSVGYITMNMSYNNEKRDDVKSTNTYDAIKTGERTATTRYKKDGHLDYITNFKIGDIIEIRKTGNLPIYVKVTKVGYLPKNTSAEEWSKKEGWNVDYFNRVVKLEIEKGEAYQIEFEYITPNSNIEQNVKHFNSRKEMLNAMFNDADGFIGEVSNSPYTKKGDKFVLKRDTEVEKMVLAISKRGIPENRKTDLLSKEFIDYLKEEKNSTKYYNVGYTSNSPEILAVTNRTLYDVNYIPKTIAYLRDTNRLKEPIVTTSLSQFKNTSTFLVDSKDTIAINYFKKNGYNYEVYDDGFDTSNREVIVEGVGDEIHSYELHTGTQYNGKFTEGGDSIWSEIANEYGIKVNGYSPNDLKNLSKEESNELEKAYRQATEDLGRPYLKLTDRGGSLVRRDYLQTKNGDAIFAIGHILYPGEYNKSGYRVKSKGPSVDGGTGYAVQMGINLNKPVHVFDYIKKQWYVYDYTKQDFVKEFPPKLTPNFTGVGTRDVDGIDWVKDTIRNIYFTTKNGLYGPNRNIKQISDIFTVPTSKNQITVKFNKIGWSNTNKNIVGDFITTYTAQTTAHHLDAVKQGSIPNVNEYTFPVYKFLTTIGLDHEFSVGFIRQPAITKLVANNNLINSVFFSSKNDAVKMSLADIATRLGRKAKGKYDITHNTSLGVILNSFKEDGWFVEEFKYQTGIDITKVNNNKILKLRIPLNKADIFKRIKDEAAKTGDIYENAVQDVIALIQFSQYKRTTDKLNEYIQALNTDKIGAAPSIRETRQMRDRINKLRQDSTLTIDGESMINKIYPADKYNPNAIKVDESVYAPIAAVYSMATLPSIEVGGKIFTMENEDFALAEETVQQTIHKRLNTEEYKEYKRYAVATLYNTISKLLTPLTVDERGRIIPYSEEIVNEDTELKTASPYWDRERSRIVGYGITDEGNFKCANVNAPTADEIKEYLKLTPAQKIMFIQRNFSDNQGVFNNIKVTLINNTDVRNKGISRQYLNYDDQVDSIEDLFSMFENSFSNHNPLIKLAAIDLIKYAFIAEGFNFKSGYITKIIPNDTLYSDINDGGMDIIEDIKTKGEALYHIIQSEEFINNFMRSHSGLAPLFTLTSKDKTTNIFVSCSNIDGLVSFDMTTENTQATWLHSQLMLQRYIDGYIRVTHPVGENKTPVTTLYKVLGRNEITDENGFVKGYKDIYLVPLNLLDKYESYDISYNQNYNQFNDYSYYVDRVDNLANETESYRSYNINKFQEYKEKMLATDKNDINTRAQYSKMSEQYLRESQRSRSKAIDKYPGKSNPIDRFNPITNKTFDNPNALMELAESSDKYLSGAVSKFINDINQAFISKLASGDNIGMFVVNNSYQLNNLIPAGTFVIQDFTNEDGDIVRLQIGHTPTKNLLKTIYNITHGKNDSNVNLKYAIKQLAETNTRPNAANYFYITQVPITNEEAEERLNAATDLIADDSVVEDTGLPRRGTTRVNIDVVSASVMKQIQYEALKNNDAIARRFIQTMERRGINRNYRSSLAEHRKDIYRAAARYYQSAANSLINALNGYEIAGQTLRMDSPEFFEELAKHDEEFNKVAKIILDAITFGNRIAPVMQLDIAAEDKETKEGIQSIQNSINSIRTNTGFKTALANMFNIYFKKYSTNSDISDDLLNLRDQFGDIDTIVALISDPAEINNNEVQVILKNIYSMFSKAEMFDTERNIKEWKEQLAKIDAMTESLDMDKIIDSEHGMLRQDYNDKYLEDKQKVIDDFNEARKHKDESQEAFTKYIKAKYARDEFMYKHQHQLIVDDYYKEDLAMRKEVMDKAKDLYYEYMRYITELYNLNTGEDTDNEDVKKRKTELINHITAMRADNDITGELKPIQQRIKVKALNDYITKHRELAHKYFNTQEYDGFQEDYNRYNDYIKYYDKTHKRLSLEEKLDDPEYREAYNWIKNNGKLRYTDEAVVKIANAFDVLTKRQTAISNNTLRAIRKMEGVIDDNGIIDGRKLTNEQIAQLREEEMDELATKYENGNGEMMLIKMISIRPPIMNSRPKDDESKKILMDLQYKDNKLKFKIIQHINEILMKAVDADTGEVNMAYLFNNNYVTNEDREELAELYSQLRFLRSETLRKFKKRKNKVYEDVIDNNAYNKAKIFYDTLPKGSIQAKQWLNIFTELNADGNLVPNSNLFGYHQPKEDFIDHDRTNARDFIFDNIEFVPNEYYWLAAEEHKEKGDYDEWFRQNNVYNPYTHKYEPLKIWTTMQAKPDSELAKSIEYVPTFDNMERSVKEEYINNAENRKRLGLNGEGYKEFGSNYKKGDSKYDTNIKLNTKEQALKDLIQQTLNKYATTYQGRKFVGRGFLPRSRSVQINPRWAGGQLMSLFGVSWHSGADSDSFHDIVDYSHDREADMKMLSLLKGKGTKDYIPSPKRMEYKTAEEYEKAVEEVRKQNHEIYLQNLAIDNKNLNRNWRKVMEDFVYNATIFNSRQAAKPYLYLLLEDLKNNDAYKIKGMWNKRLLKDVDTSTKDDPQYQRQAQTRTQQLIHNLARRLLFDQYHENSVARSVANLLQNITSAKYMVFNLYGGVANITTGKVNIRAEEFANEYFGFRELKTGEKEYLTNICAFLASRFTDKSPTLAAAFIKQFHVVDFDQVLQFAANEGELNTKVREFRDFLYSFQSMGEHYMQNTVLFAMLKSNRLYTDTNGVMRIGDFKDFTWDVEKTAMRNILAEYPEVATDYEMYIKGIREYDIETKLDISTGRKNLNRNFLYSIRDNTNQYSQDLYKEIATKYHAEVNKLMKKAKQQFMTNPTVESLYEFVDGRAELKKEYKDKVPTDNKIGDLETLIGQFKEKVKSVNKKIHGVYDKDGAAQIESKWWGSLVAQYHKHLPTGIWKRWRRKGYYSEFRGSRERGSYQTFIDFMGTEFVNYKKRIKQQSTDTNIVLASIQVTFQSIINTLTNLQFNWNNLAPWEKANMRRNLGDLSGVLIACLVVAALYGLSDDDDIKDDKFKASLLYLADRLYSDSTMYSPVGLVSEYKTAWSSPIASANGPSDLMKAMTIIPQYLFDPDYDKEYTTGLYKGQDKLMVLLRRNLPGIRPWDRIQMITRNNNYYKIDSSQIGISIAKDFGELLAGE